MGHNDLQFNLLQSELVVLSIKETELAFARHVFTTQFNPSFLPTQLGCAPTISPSRTKET
jgi:hypothetical protein